MEQQGAVPFFCIFSSPLVNCLRYDMILHKERRSSIVIKSTFMGIKKRVKERPDLSYLFMSSADYGSWGRQGSTQKNYASAKNKAMQNCNTKKKGGRKK